MTSELFNKKFIPAYLENTNNNVFLRAAYMGATYNKKGFWAECVGLKIFCLWNERLFEEFATILDERDLIEIRGKITGDKGRICVRVENMRPL